MHAHAFYTLIALAVHAHGSPLPFILDVFLKRRGGQDASASTMFNGTCDECLCKVFRDSSTANSVALNCFANHTCQLFSTFPVSYKVQPFVGAQLYFLRGIFPNKSQCCMPNMTDLLLRLKISTPFVVTLSFDPGSFGYDEANPNEAVVLGGSSGQLYWFSPIDMTSLRNQTSDNRDAIALHNHSIFTGKDGDPAIHVLDESNLAPVANIPCPSFWQLRKFIFLNNGQTIAVTTQFNQSVTFVNVQSSTQYNVQVRIITVLRCVSSICLVMTISGRSSLPIGERARCGESQRHVLLCLVMGRQQYWLLQI